LRRKRKFALIKETYGGPQLSHIYN